MPRFCCLFWIIKKIGKPYLVGWLCLEFCLLLSALTYFISPHAEFSFSARTVLILAFCLLDISLWVFAMRAIGLINRYFQHRLPWYD